MEWELYCGMFSLPVSLFSEAYSPWDVVPLVNGANISVWLGAVIFKMKIINPTLAKEETRKLQYLLCIVYYWRLKYVIFRKFSSLTKDDHKVLFFGLEPLLSLSQTLCLKVGYEKVFPIRIRCVRSLKYVFTCDIQANVNLWKVSLWTWALCHILFFHSKLLIGMIFLRQWDLPCWCDLSPQPLAGYIQTCSRKYLWVSLKILCDLPF